MGFLKQETPQIDFEEWSKGTRAEKITPMARHWAEVGFGTPVLLHLFYVVKIALYILAAWLLALTTTGINGFTDVAHWYAEPIVFEKVVLYTMLFEVVGLGCGFGPLNNRFFPPMGSILYWLRPGTIRLPPRCCTARCWVCSSSRSSPTAPARFLHWGQRSGCCRRGRSGRCWACWRCWVCATRSSSLPPAARCTPRSRLLSCSPTTAWT